VVDNFIIHHADCLEILQELPDQSVDTVIIDPPYGIDVLNDEWCEEKIKKRIDASSKSTIKKIPVGMKFDPASSKNLGIFLQKVSTEIFRVLKPGSFYLVFSQPRSSHRVGCAIEDAGFELRDQLIWYHNRGQCKAQGMQNFIKKAKTISENEKDEAIAKLDGFKTPQLGPTFETIWLGQKPKEGKFWENFLKYNVGLVDFREGSRKVSFHHGKPSKSEREEAGKHPTLKPVSLMRDLVKIFSPEDGIVLDCFCGSGTTGVAAMMENRRFIGVDASQNWHEVSSKRIEKYLTISETTYIDETIT